MALVIPIPGARRRRRPPRQLRPTLIEQDYARALLRLVDDVREAARPLLDELPGLLESAAREREDAAREDAGEGARIRDLIARMRRTLADAVATRPIEDLAFSIATRTERHQKLQLIRQIRAALGVDVLLTDRKLANVLEGFVAENVALIRSIPDEVATRFEKTITRGVASGLRWRDLAKDVDGAFEFGRDRAHLIARDQVGKFYGQVNKTRQKEIGVRRYRWRTARDGRVRGNPVGLYPSARYSHHAREGEIFEWDDPPPDGHPGEPPLCRCHGEPVLEDLL